MVLVIDDDGELLAMYEALLAAMGHEPVTKIAIASPPETVREVGADAVVVDLETADDDSTLRIIEQLRSDSELRDLPIILCSWATDTVHPLRRRLQALNVPVVLKPFPIEALEEQLQAALKLRPTG